MYLAFTQLERENGLHLHLSETVKKPLHRVSLQNNIICSVGATRESVTSERRYTVLILFRIYFIEVELCVMLHVMNYHIICATIVYYIVIQRTYQYGKK